MLKFYERPEQPAHVTTLPSHRADENRLRAWVERLAIPRHIVVNAASNRWVRDELKTAFEATGLRVQQQGAYHNLIALPAPRGPEPITIIAAHYDSVPNCPGADDNASGLAVMLECARLIARDNTKVGFIAFNAEEDGMLGSRDFVMNGLPALDVKIAATHVLEMVGFCGAPHERRALPLPKLTRRFEVPNFIGLVGKSRSNKLVTRALRSEAAPGLRVVAAKTWGPMHLLVPDLVRSDHFPYWMAGEPAVLWTDTADFRNPNYHKSTDTPDTLDYAFMAEVTELLCAVAR